MNLSNSYYVGIKELDDQSPIQDEGTKIYAWHFPYPISYPTIVAEADVNIQWRNGQPKKFNLFFDGYEDRNYLYASLLTTHMLPNEIHNVKVFSIGY
jgi:hypothetical protein